MFSLDAIQILIFLIPGFISEALLNQFIVTKEKSELWTVIEALIFSMLIYVVYSFAISRSPVALTVVSTPNTSTSSTITYNGIAFIWLVGFSIIIPIILSYLINNDLYMKLLRVLHISKKTARQTTWLDVFLDKQKRYIIINFTDESRLFGWPKYYSDNPEQQFIYLMQPAWIVKNEKNGEYERLELDIDGILITPAYSIESIEFYKEMSEYKLAKK